MRKLIERTVHLIECDNPECDFKIPYSEEEEKELHTFIDVPCPTCGQNLLTLDDYIRHKKLVMIVNWVNKWFSWLTIFQSKKAKAFVVSVHDGVKMEAFEIFASLHPVEAYDSQPEDFCNYMRSEGYDITDEQVKELIDGCR